MYLTDWKVEVTDEGECWIRIPGGHDLYFGDMEETDKCCFEVANLVAAAPELLAMCKELYYEYNHIIPCQDATEQKAKKLLKRLGVLE